MLHLLLILFTFNALLVTSVAQQVLWYDEDNEVVYRDYGLDQSRFRPMLQPSDVKEVIFSEEFSLRNERIVQYVLSTHRLIALLTDLQLQQINAFNHKPDWPFEYPHILLGDGGNESSSSTEECGGAFFIRDHATNTLQLHADQCPPFLKFVTIILNYSVQDVGQCCSTSDDCCDAVLEVRSSVDSAGGNISYQHYVMYLSDSAAAQISTKPVEYWVFQPLVNLYLSAADAPFVAGRGLTSEMLSRLAPHRDELPHFVILGAQKAGTTSLYNYLTKHPLVGSNRKEVHYFTYAFNNRLGDFHFSDLPLLQRTNASSAVMNRKRMELASAVSAHRMQYRVYFASITSGDGLIFGDASPSYLLYGDIVIPRLRAIIPNTRLIVLLREPTQRAISAYRMYIANTASEASVAPSMFGDIIRKEIRLLQQMGITSTSSIEDFSNYLVELRNNFTYPELPIVARGLYALQLRLWYAHWRRDRLLIIPMSRIWMKKDRSVQEEKRLQETMNIIYEFLGLPSFQLKEDDMKVYYESKAEVEILPADVAYLNEFYKPFNEALYELLGSDNVW